MSLYEVNPDSIQLMAHPHEREIEVFEAALELPPGQREAYIEKASTGNPDLSQRVRALLHAAENGAEFLTTAPSELAPSRPISRSLAISSAATSSWNKSAKAA